MKLSVVILTLLGVVFVGGLASAVVTDHNYTVTAGWNLLGLPGIPLNPDPSKPHYQLPGVFGSIPVDGRLYRFDAATQGLYAYDEWAEPPTTFGNMLLADGYWLKADSGGNISYSGLNDNDAMDVWVSMPRTGWILMGNPFSYSFPWQNAKVTDGNVTVDIETAARTNGWLESVGYWFNNQTQGLIEIGLPDDYSPSDTLQPWHGYWFRSKVDKIALIFPSIP